MRGRGLGHTAGLTNSANLPLNFNDESMQRLATIGDEADAIITRCTPKSKLVKPILMKRAAQAPSQRPENETKSPLGDHATSKQDSTPLNQSSEAMQAMMAQRIVSAQILSQQPSWLHLDSRQEYEEPHQEIDDIINQSKRQVINIEDMNQQHATDSHFTSHS